MRIIGQNPGITVAELGKKMRLKAPNYLYRVLPDLEKEGRVRKKGRGYHPGGRKGPVRATRLTAKPSLTRSDLTP